MSVPVGKRTLSDVEFYNNAIKLRLKITNLLLKDFCIKDKIRNLQTIAGMKGISEEDKNLLDNFAKKYGKTEILLEKYPNWLIEYLRTNVLNLLRRLIENITNAYNIYPLHEYEYFNRRTYQTNAINNCKCLLQEFQYIIEIIPCNIEKMSPFIDMITREIDLLKNWKKSDNRMLKKIREHTESTIEIQEENPI